MKRIFYFLTLLPLLTVLFSFTRPQQGIDVVVAAMKSGNAAQLSRYFDNMIEITMPDKSNSYSKSQAELIMKEFFATNGVKNFEIRHKGDNNGSEYCVGNLQTRSGMYRTTLFLKQRSDRLLLQEIRLESN